MFTLYNLFLVARHIAYEHMVKKLWFAEYAESTSKSFGPNGARNTNIRPTGRQQNLDKATSAVNNPNAASITERGSAETTTGLDYWCCNDLLFRWIIENHVFTLQFVFSC